MRIHRFLVAVVIAVAFFGCKKNPSSHFPVSGVTLNKATTTIILGLETSETLTATIEPDNAINKEALWSSSNRSVAVVDQEGNVTAIAEGTAIIRITTLDGYYTANCTVTVSTLTGIPHITMTIESASVSLALRGLNPAFIDWGDGTHDRYTPSDYTHFTHTYNDSRSRSIAIFGVNIVLLECNNNQLTDLNVSKSTALTYLRCHNNQLTNLDVDGFSALMELDCAHNQIAHLDVRGCTMLEELDCSHNQLTSLDVSEFSALTVFDCSHNQLTSLDVSGCTALKELDCSYNQLTSLYVIRLSRLSELDCSYNQLTEMNMNMSSSLRILNCRYNYMSAGSLNVLFRTLNAGNLSKIIYIGNNGPNYDGSGTVDCDRSLAGLNYNNIPTWTVID